MKVKIARWPDDSVLLLVLQQGAFALDAPAVAGEGAVTADDAVARDGERDGIGGAGAGDGADGAGGADSARHVGVGARFAARNAAQLFPYALLKRGGADVERNVGEAGGRVGGVERFEQAAQRIPHHARVFGEGGGRELPTQFAGERVGAVAEPYRADAARRYGYEQE